MAKRATVPQGKALFFRPPEPVESVADVVTDERPFVAERAPSEPASEGRRSAKPATRQSAIFLEEQHIDWLEDRCREARKNGGRAIRKAAIIRALLDVAMDAGVDLTGLKREEDLTVRVREALHG